MWEAVRYSDIDYYEDALIATVPPNTVGLRGRMMK
jgi:hypothetical protein